MLTLETSIRKTAISLKLVYCKNKKYIYMFKGYIFVYIWLGGYHINVLVVP